MEIRISNCNNIREGLITLKENKLNVKYGINGTGKTTVSKAIEYMIKEKAGERDLLKKLTPFGNNENSPSVEMDNENINKIAVFNEEYVKQFIFVEDELVKNSFEIFIKDEKYLENEIEIEELLKDIKNIFKADDGLEIFLKDLKTLTETTKSKTSTTFSSLKKGNKLDEIPIELKRYEEYLKSNNSVTWLGWHAKGQEHLADKDTCPYCTSNLIGNDIINKEKIEKLGETYKSKEVENLLKTLELFNGLEKYYDGVTNSKIKQMYGKIEGISKIEIAYLERVREQTITLIEILENLRELDFHKLKKIELDKLSEELEKIKIRQEAVDYYKSSTSKNIFDKINSSIEELQGRTNVLKGKIAIQNRKIANTINEYKKEINDFFKIAGYEYEIEFEDKEGVYKIKLKHKNAPTNMNNVETYLSYGEKNAFALILFMYKTLKENVDLIILDDPISSFDKNKKYAIFEKLFTGSGNFANKTLLLLTHDFEAIIDTTYNRKLQSSIQPSSYFISNNKGELIEKEIKKEDIKTCIQIAKENIKDPTKDNLIRLVYLRRLKEIEGNKKLVYNLISSLFHKRQEPTVESSKGSNNMTQKEILNATSEIIKDIENFNYMEEYAKVKSDERMITLYKNGNNYEKLQIYRIIKDGENTENNIVKKFANESFHIENDFLIQLSPSEYITVPNYIIDICDEEIKKMEERNDS